MNGILYLKNKYGKFHLIDADEQWTQWPGLSGDEIEEFYLLLEEDYIDNQEYFPVHFGECLED